MSLAAALAGLSILIIGDSHLAQPSYLMSSLHDGLQRQGAKVHSIGMCGALPYDWTVSKVGNCGGAERIGDQPATRSSTGSTTAVAQLIRAEHPDLVLVVLGDTMAAYKQPDFPMNWVWQQVSTLTGAIAATGTRCAWVGPPWGQEGGSYGKTYARAELVSRFLSTNVEPCIYIDSLEMSTRGQWSTVDGQHFGSNGYRSWGNGIAKAVMKLPLPTGAASTTGTTGAARQ
ncbi:SGNH/GDSL hydrolase family protein [Variovorax sp. H27-G14]|uniref:SGNH/GDSL hydrolase family protein n=1 Tax=Variovorax sp. H27-G14 TaxID=3111914 RepID=UPI0038FC7C7D